VYAKDSPYGVTTLINSPFIDVLLMFTYVGNPVTSGAREGVLVDVLRFWHIHTHALLAPNNYLSDS